LAEAGCDSLGGLDLVFFGVSELTDLIVCSGIDLFSFAASKQALNSLAISAVLNLQQQSYDWTQRVI